jgi:hypothetical protein
VRLFSPSSSHERTDQGPRVGGRHRLADIIDGMNDRTLFGVTPDRDLLIVIDPPLIQGVPGVSVVPSRRAEPSWRYFPAVSMTQVPVRRRVVVVLYLLGVLLFFESASRAVLSVDDLFARVATPSGP